MGTEKSKENKAKKEAKGFKLENIKHKAQELNDIAYESAEYLVDEAVDKGTKWQNLGAKVVEESLKVSSAQQDIVFSALESVKDQFQHGKKRFKTLFSKN